MRYFFIYLSAFACSSTTSTGQKISSSLTEKQLKYAKTIVEVAAYFKSQPTLAKKLDTPNIQVDSFYDAVIDRYFDRDRMTKELSKHTDVFAVEGKIDILRLVLNISDIWLDYVPNDSLFIESAARINYYDAEDVDQIANSLGIVYGSNKSLLLMIWFDKNSKKMIIVNPGALPEKEKKDIKRFFPFTDNRLLDGLKTQ